MAPKGKKQNSRARKKKRAHTVSPVAALRHLELAEEYYKAYCDLPQNGPSGVPMSWPRYFVFCHSIELALNAFLLVHPGWSDQEIIPFHHDISELMKETIALGLNISQTAQSEIDHLSKAHRIFGRATPNRPVPLL